MKDEEIVTKKKASSLVVVMGVIFACTSVFTFMLDYAIDGIDWLGEGEVELLSFHDHRTWDRILDLKGDWKFRTGDDVELSELGNDDSRWRRIQVPGEWENEGYPGYDGYAWYWREFSLDTVVTGGTLLLSVGKIDDVGEVFLNGKSIGKTGEFPLEGEDLFSGEGTYRSAWGQDCICRVPLELINLNGRNKLAVRVFDGLKGGGIRVGRVGLYATDMPQPEVELSGDWKIAYGDKPEWKEVLLEDDGMFSNIELPNFWEAQGAAGYDGYAWLRKSFAWKKGGEFDEHMVLLLGKIDDTDQVFLNGKLIGGTGAIEGPGRAEDKVSYLKNRVYEFSASDLEKENTLSVRVYDHTGGGGIYSGPLGILSKKAYEESLHVLERERGWDLSEVVDWLMGRN